MKPVVYALRRICSCLNVRMCVYGFTRDKLRVRRKYRYRIRNIEIRPSAVCIKCKKTLSKNPITALLSSIKYPLKPYRAHYGFTFLTRPHVPVK